ncbi:hypothetical protein Xcab_01191 [Xenorhabdus cabanillasii JM26]|nr:hypothetical protein Xcab_01191 [Xenorhabdus cabanillasii JM26]
MVFNTQIRQRIGVIKIDDLKTITLRDLLNLKILEMITLLIPGCCGILQPAGFGIIAQVDFIDFSKFSINQCEEMSIRFPCRFYSRNFLMILYPISSQHCGGQHNIFNFCISHAFAAEVTSHSFPGNLVITARPHKMDVAVGNIRIKMVITTGPFEYDVTTISVPIQTVVSSCT